MREVRQAFARMQLETEKTLRRAREELDSVFRQQRDQVEKLLRHASGITGSPPKPPRKPRRKPPRKRGGSEAVTVEPNRPKLGEGGAAAALEFDE